MKKIKKHLKSLTAEDIFIALFNYIFLAIVGVICFIPFLYVLSTSLTSEQALSSGTIRLIPSQISFDAYSTMFKIGGGFILKAFGNSIFITLAGTSLSLVITAGLAYPLSKKQLPFRNPFMGYVLFAMLFGGGFIPYILLIRNWLNWYNNYAALIIPGAYSAWNMIIMRNFFMAIPDSLEESAMIDGANEIRILISIVLPLSLPVLATLGLFTAVSYWNAWMPALLFVDSDKYPLMMVLMNVVNSMTGTNIGNGQSNIVPTRQLQMAVVCVVALPIFMVYPFLQKHFAKGMLLGSIKG